MELDEGLRVLSTAACHLAAQPNDKGKFIRKRSRQIPSLESLTTPPFTIRMNREDHTYMERGCIKTNCSRFNKGCKGDCAVLKVYKSPEEMMGMAPELASENSMAKINRNSKDFKLKMRTFSNQISRCPPAYEFGTLIAFNVGTEVDKYLTFLDDWIRCVRIPDNYDSFIDMVRKWGRHRHRIIAIRFLCSLHNHKAKMFNAVFTQKMTKELYAYFMSEKEAQSLDQLGSDVLEIMMNSGFIMLVGALVAIGYNYTLKDKVNEMVELFGKVKTLINSKSDLVEATDFVSNAFTSVANAIKGVWNWLKQLAVKVVSAINSDTFGKQFMYSVLIITLVPLAIEYCRSVVPYYTKDIRKWLVAKLGLEDAEEYLPANVEAQGKGSVNVLVTLLSFIGMGVSGQGNLSSYFHSLPKVVSVAKAFEWIFENFVDFWAHLMEMITGELKGVNALERDIIAWKHQVEKFSVLIDNADSDVIHTDEFGHTKSSLEIQRKNIEHKVRTSKVQPRMMVAAEFNRADQRFTNDIIKFECIRKQAKPRPIPVWLFIHGQPGVGKSSALDYLRPAIWKYVREHGEGIISSNYSPGQVFTYNQSEEYMDGYRGQFYTIIDDLFQGLSLDDRTRTSQALIHMICAEPHSLRVADMNMKAATFFTSRCVISTANLNIVGAKGLNLGLASPAALVERVSICVELKQDGYHINPGYEVETEAGKLSKLTEDELVQVVGEMIIQRDLETKLGQDVAVLPRFEGKIKGGRITVGYTPDEKAKVLKAAGVNVNCVKRIPQYLADDDKGKEKESQSREGEIDYGILRETRGKSDEEEPGESEVEIIDYKLNDGLAQRREFIDATLDQLAKFNAQKVRFRKDTTDYFVEIEKPDEQEQQILDFVDHASKSGYDVSAYNDPESGEEDNAEDPYFWRLSPWLREKLAKVCVFFKMPVLNNRMVKFLRDNSKHYLRIVSNYLKPRFASVWFRSKTAVSNFVTDKVVAYIRGMMTDKIKKGLKILTYITMFVGGFVLGFVVTKTILRLLFSLMPRSAFEVQSGEYDRMYDRDVKHKNVKARAGHRNGKGKGRNKNFYAQGIDASSKMINNMMTISVRYSSKSDVWNNVEKKDASCSSWMLFVFGSVAIVPGHTIFQNMDDSEEAWLTLGPEIKYTERLSKCKVLGELGGDLILVEFPNIANFKDITGLFMDDIPTYDSLYHVGVDLRSRHRMTFVQKALSWKNEINEMPTNKFYGQFDTDMKFMGIQCKRGDCGTVYTDKHGKICAIHMGGAIGSDVGYGVSVSRLELLKFKEKVPTLHDCLEVEPHGCPSISGLIPLGTLSHSEASRPNTKTQITESRYDWKSFPLGVTDSSPAPLTPVQRGEKVVHPSDVAFGKFGKQESPPTSDLVIQIMDFLPIDFKCSNVRTVTREEAIYGIPGYMKSLEMTSSAGYFYKKRGMTRRQLFYDVKGKQRLHEAFLHKYEAMKEVFLTGNYVPFIYTAELKDELRSPAKVEAVDTRMYDSQEVTSLVMTIEELGTFFVELTKNPVHSPIGLCLNPHSKDWGLLHTWLRGDPSEKRFPIAGDFSAFDMSVKGDIYEKFVELICRVHPSPERVRLIMNAMRDGRHIYGKYVFAKPWGTSSGSYITGMFNSFANWYIHKHAFVAKYSEKDWKEVRCTFTGDDSLLSIPGKFKEYNTAYLKQYFWDVFRMRYTSADKSDVVKDISWDEVVYLKRQFIHGTPGMMAPLDKKSICNIARWAKTSEDLETMQSRINSIQIESFHHGKKVFDLVYKWCCNQARTTDTFFHVRTWQEIYSLKISDY